MKRQLIATPELWLTTEIGDNVRFDARVLTRIIPDKQNSAWLFLHYA